MFTPHAICAMKNEKKNVHSSENNATAMELAYHWSILYIKMREFSQISFIQKKSFSRNFILFDFN